MNALVLIFSIDQVVDHAIGLYIECANQDYERLNDFLAMSYKVAKTNVVFGGLVQC